MKKYINISPQANTYVNQCGIFENENLEKLRKKTEELLKGKSIMLSDALTGQLLALLIKLHKVKTIMDVGVFTGYSTLWMAEALLDDGKLIACDVNEEWIAIGKPFWKQAGVEEKINIKIGPALNTMNALVQAGTSVDMIYLDANKDQYPEYYEAAKKLLKSGGLLVIDNTLFGGKIFDDKNMDPAVEGVRVMNEKIAKDRSVEKILLPISDGVTLVMKY